MAGSESEMGDETEFQTAYQAFQAEKQEARRLQGWWRHWLASASPLRS